MGEGEEDGNKKSRRKMNSRLIALGLLAFALFAAKKERDWKTGISTARLSRTP